MKRLMLLTLVTLLALGGTGQAQTHTPLDSAKKKEKVTICHRTGSNTNPYVLIRVSKSALKAHARHTGDIIPAPAGGCPACAHRRRPGGTALTATLTGAAEAPGPGDPDGSGQATIRLTAGEGRLASSSARPASPSQPRARTSTSALQAARASFSYPRRATGSASGCVTVPRRSSRRFLPTRAALRQHPHVRLPRRSDPRPTLHLTH